MKKPALCLVIMALCGCATSKKFNQERVSANNSLNSIISIVTKDAESRLVAPNCENRSIPNKFIKGHMFTAGICGLLNDSLLSKGQLKKEICPTMKLKGKACEDLVKETFFARMQERYSLEAMAEVNKQCTLYPTECQSMTETELKMLNVHNEKIQKQFMSNIDRVGESHSQKLRAISQAEAEESTQRRQAFGNALGAMGTSFQNSTAPAPQPAYRNQQCSGIPPIANYGCRMECINGAWASICN